MATIPQSRLEQVIERFDEVAARMGATTDGDEIVALSREHAELKPVVEAARDLIAMREGLEEAEAMTKGDDPEMAELAQEEVNELKSKIPEAESEMQLLLLPKDADDKANIVLEVRAGTGGDEAALFAGDLFRMYSRYADDRPISAVLWPADAFIRRVRCQCARWPGHVGDRAQPLGCNPVWHQHGLSRSRMAGRWTDRQP